MRWAHESNKRLVEPIRLPVGLTLPPVAHMPSEAEHDFMTTQVLRALICITPARSRRAHQCQTYGLVVRFIRGVLAIREHSHAVRFIFVGEVDPLVRGYFELPFFFIWSLDRAYVPVVSCHFVRGCK